MTNIRNIIHFLIANLNQNKNDSQKNYIHEMSTIDLLSPFKEWLCASPKDLPNCPHSTQTTK